ncbi:hypothetical protein V8C26DRAFT_387549 [Trichoderma gracile]
MGTQRGAAQKEPKRHHESVALAGTAALARYLSIWSMRVNIGMFNVTSWLLGFRFESLPKYHYCRSTSTSYAVLSRIPLPAHTYLATRDLVGSVGLRRTCILRTSHAAPQMRIFLETSRDRLIKDKSMPGSRRKGEMKNGSNNSSSSEKNLNTMSDLCLGPEPLKLQRQKPALVCGSRSIQGTEGAGTNIILWSGAKSHRGALPDSWHRLQQVPCDPCKRLRLQVRFYSPSRQSSRYPDTNHASPLVPSASSRVVKNDGDEKSILHVRRRTKDSLS